VPIVIFNSVVQDYVMRQVEFLRDWWNRLFFCWLLALFNIHFAMFMWLDARWGKW